MNDFNQIEWSIEKSRDNNDILKINGRYIHSKFSPQKEAVNFIFPGKNLILIFGIGLAYHLNNIVKNNQDSIFIVFEPYEKIFELSKKYIDNGLIESDDKICFLQNLDDSIIYNFLNLKSFVTENRLKTYSNLGYKNILPELEKSFFKTVKRNIEILIQNTVTESNFIPLWTKNFLRNMQYFGESLILKPSKDNLNDNLAVIACAGPTLINELDKIKRFREKITLFAVDTAIKPLLKYGIKPDFIVTLDAQHYTIDDYVKILPDETTIILDAISYPEIASIHKNVHFTITENIFPKTIIEYFFNHFKIKKFGIMTGGTISDYTASLAILFGFSRIYFAGLDLSYPLFQSHSKETPFYNRVLNNSHYYNTIQNNFINSIVNRQIEKVESRVSGLQVYTDFILKNYSHYFNQLALIEKSVSFYYSDHNALQLSNFKGIDLSELISQKETTRLYGRDLLKNQEFITLDKKDLKNFYDNLINDIYKKASMLDALFKNSDFNNNDLSILNEWNSFFDQLFLEFPFLKKFVLMTEIILQKKQISQDHILWYKHIGHKTLQSMYFIIRIIQKILKGY